MDDFGVLTERFGLKPQGKAAPMASLKRPSSNNNDNSKPSPFGGGDRTKPYTNGGISDDYDFLGGVANSSSASQSGGFGGSSFDYDSFFSGSSSSAKSNVYDNDDIFGGMPGLNTLSSSNYGSESKAANAYGDGGIFGAMPSSNSLGSRSDDILGAFDSAPKQGGPVGGLFDGFVSASSGAKNSNNGSSFFGGDDDLMPGFGSSTDQNRRKFADKDPWQSSTTRSSKSSFASPEDPFVVLESTSTSTSKVPYDSSDLFSDPLETISKVNNSKGSKPPRLKSPPKSAQVSKGGTGSSFGAAKSSDVSSFDEFESFVMGGKTQNAHNSVNGRTISKASSRSEDDLESFFGVGHRSSSAPRARTTTPSDPIFDVLNNNNNKGSKGTQPRVPPNPPSGTSSTMKKSSSVGGFFGDLSSMFDGVQVSGEFEEVKGESEERRRARLGRYQRTNERVLKAMDDMNQRDFQSQQEQEERRRIAETLDADIKRWAAGKEGNMRALLSSLQHILWLECGWEPVSLTDIITSTSVKKVYRKATLCVHPDKVQQRGATLQQKYTAEKVFDILKEAWNKFNKEELRSLG